VSGVLVALVCAAALVAPGVSAAAETLAVVPALHAGAIELGVSGALTAVEGSTHATALVRAGRFSRLGDGLVAFEGEVSYSHVSSLDLLGLEAARAGLAVGADCAAGADFAAGAGGAVGAGGGTYLAGASTPSGGLAATGEMASRSTSAGCADLLACAPQPERRASEVVRASM